MGKRLVLIATDFGVDSNLVARCGVELARALDAEPVLLHVSAFTSPSPSSFYPEASRAIREQAVRDLDRLATLAGLGPGEGTRLVRSGHAEVIIRDVARELGVCLIVVGTRRTDTIERWLVGSVAEAVTRHATCPVIVIPRPGKGKGQREARAS